MVIPSKMSAKPLSKSLYTVKCNYIFSWINMTVITFVGPTVVYLVKRHISVLYLMGKVCPFPKRYVKSITQAFNELFGIDAIVLNAMLGTEL